MSEKKPEYEQYTEYKKNEDGTYNIESIGKNKFLDKDKISSLKSEHESNIIRIQEQINGLQKMIDLENEEIIKIEKVLKE